MPKFTWRSEFRQNYRTVSCPQSHLSLLGSLASLRTYRHLAAKVGTSKAGESNGKLPQELAQDTVCQSHTGHRTGLWFLPARPLRLNTNEWMNPSGPWGWLSLQQKWVPGVFPALYRRPVRRADNLTTYKCWLSWNLGASTSWNPQNLSRPVMGLLYLYLYPYFNSLKPFFTVAPCISQSHLISTPTNAHT